MTDRGEPTAAAGLSAPSTPLSAPSSALGADEACLRSVAALDRAGDVAASTLVFSLLLRAALGGMKGDVAMLRGAALVWARRAGWRGRAGPAAGPEGPGGPADAWPTLGGGEDATRGLPETGSAAAFARTARSAPVPAGSGRVVAAAEVDRGPGTADDANACNDDGDDGGGGDDDGNKPPPTPHVGGLLAAMAPLFAGLDPAPRTLSTIGVPTVDDVPPEAVDPHVSDVVSETLARRPDLVALFARAAALEARGGAGGGGGDSGVDADAARQAASSACWRFGSGVNGRRPLEPAAGGGGVDGDGDVKDAPPTAADLALEDAWRAALPDVSAWRDEYIARRFPPEPPSRLAETVNVDVLRATEGSG